jgi:hypothetical protein
VGQFQSIQASNEGCLTFRKGKADLPGEGDKNKQSPPERAMLRHFVACERAAVLCEICIAAVQRESGPAWMACSTRDGQFLQRWPVPPAMERRHQCAAASQRQPLHPGRRRRAVVRTGAPRIAGLGRLDGGAALRPPRVHRGPLHRERLQEGTPQRDIVDPAPFNATPLSASPFNASPFTRTPFTRTPFNASLFTTTLFTADAGKGSRAHQRSSHSPGTPWMRGERSAKKAHSPGQHLTKNSHEGSPQARHDFPHREPVSPARLPDPKRNSAGEVSA